MSVSPRFLALLTAEGLEGKRALDVGCGQGRVTRWLAPRVKHAVGLDRDAAALETARRLAKGAGIELVTAHLCASDAIIERSARALAPGQCLSMVAFHVEQWKETGRVSRFAYDEVRMERALRFHGFAPEVLEVERETTRFASVAEGLAAAVGLEDRWRADGRWFRFLAFLEEGGRTLTRAHVIVKARRS